MALDDYGVECSSSCSLSTRRQKKYDVFVSFRGEDTRRSFTDHLFAALELKEITTFRDNEDLKRGEIIKPSLYQAIEESFSAIVVLSKNYATSTWCLDELQKILQSKNVLGLHVFPIFYGVDPSDVRHQTGSFAEAFEKHEQKFTHDKLKVQRWRNVLKEVADLAGWSSENWYETKLIEKVVEMVRSKLDDRPIFDSNDESVVKTQLNDEGLVGIDVKISGFDSFLATNTLGEVQFIGIWGMGGLGKTTLARVVYERIRKNYEVCVFLENVREQSTKDGDLVLLQKELLSHSKRRTGMEVCNCYEGKKLIKRSLCNKKVLLVLDDVSDINQLENLAGKQGWFGKGSTIIITTRDNHLLVEHGVSQYMMNFLSEIESRQLFLQKAFEGEEPNEDYLELSKTVVKSAKGLPLALKVFGSFLCGRSIQEWEDALKKISSTDPIFNILKVSFDGLEYNEKTIFLDIACFFNGLAMGYVKEILGNSGLYPENGIEILIEKSLVTKNVGRLWVHDMLEEMGKKIVFLESPDDAGKRSRIWSQEDANHVLGNKRGNEAIRGIVVAFDKPYAMHLDSKAFLNMSNLKYLIIGHSLFSRGQLYLPHGLQWLPNTLKVIKWERYPLVFLPRQTQLDELVALIMRQSKLKELRRGTQFFQSLKIIDLIHSTDLIRTPNFDQTPNLQRLILEGCTKLVEVHHSLGQHKNLVLVDFTGCKSIKNLPTKFEMDSLVTFILSGCSKIRKLPEFGKGMERLYRLDLEGTAISKLPQSMANLNGLAILNLKNCKSLACLPSDFQKLEAKDNMNISGCSNLSRSPENLNENEALEELNVSGAATTEGIGYPQSSSSWNHYYSLLKRAFRLQRSSTSTMFLHSPFSNLSHSLAVLILCCCNLHDGSQLSEIGNLSSLAALNLSGNNFVEFPSSLISKLPKLELIGLDDCPRLQSLSQFRANLSIIKAGDCPLLKHYVREQQLWEFVEQFESQTRYARDIFVYGGIKKLLSDYNSLINTLDDSLDLEFFMQPTRILTIPGSEVPSWFHNQSYICAEDIPHRYTTNVSFMVSRPDSCRPSEWWGIAVCLVLENDLQLVKSYFSDDLCWTYGVGKGRYSTSYRSSAIHLQSSCHHQLCIIYIRFSSFVAEQLQMVFFTYECVQKSSNLSIDKCEWRVLCKEDVEKWRNTRDDGCIVVAAIMMSSLLKKMNLPLLWSPALSNELEQLLQARELLEGD